MNGAVGRTYLVLDRPGDVLHQRLVQLGHGLHGAVDHALANQQADLPFRALRKNRRKEKPRNKWRRRGITKEG